MKKVQLLATSALISCLSVLPAYSTWAALPQQVSNQTLPSLSPMLEKSMPAVVNIMATGKNYKVEELLTEPSSEEPMAPPGEKDRGFESVGSGVIVDAKKGYILTNAHLIEKAKSATVTLSDGRHFKAKLIGLDPASDVAVLQIKADNLQSLPIGDSDKLKVGDFVVAIGNPYGLNQTVTSGIVSAVERTDLGIEGYENFIQTDASINPGNSGGALVNLEGQLIGINTAILAPYGGNVGIGFAIPSEMAIGIMEQLIEHGSLGRGIVGVTIQTLTPELANALGVPTARGALVSSVSPNSPAAAAGIKAGDVIQKVNNKTIQTGGQVKNSIGLMRAGSSFEMQVLRADKTLNFKINSADPEVYKKLSVTKNPFLHDMVLKDFNAEVPGFGQVQGVQVLQIGESAPTWRAGLRPGDIITSADGKPAENFNNLLKIANTDQEQVLLNVFRGNGALFVVVKR